MLGSEPEPDPASEATAMDAASDDSDRDAIAMDTGPPSPAKKGFRGKRKRGKKLTCGRPGRWKMGLKVVSTARATEKAACKKKRATTTKDKLDAERQSHAATARASRAKDKTILSHAAALQAEKTHSASLVLAAKAGRAATADLAKHKAKCARSCVSLGNLPTVRYEALSTRGQKVRLERLTDAAIEAADKLLCPELSPQALELLTAFWKETYKPPPDPLAEEEREPEPEPEVDPEEAWRAKWETLFRLRGIADHEGAVSAAVMRKILIACEIARLTGGRLDNVKKAMNQAILNRIEMKDMKVTVDGKEVSGGVWLNPADVIREMLMAAGAPPGGTYKINILGDGRCFGNSRNTTFYALRIVHLDGYSSTSNEAIWPLAICDCPEKRGALRYLTQDLRKALKHVQDNGCHLSETYSREFYAEEDVHEWGEAERWRQTKVWMDTLKDMRFAGEQPDVENKEREPEDENNEREPLEEEQKEEGEGEVPVRQSPSVENKEREPEEEEKEGGAAPGEAEASGNASGNAGEGGEEVPDVEADEGAAAAEDVGTEAYWNMDDSQCEETDWEDANYICNDKYCQCHESEPIPAVGESIQPSLPYKKRHVGVDLWLSADMKFLLMVTGLKGATGKYSCLYCKADLKERQDWMDQAGGSRMRSATDAVRT